MLTATQFVMSTSSFTKILPTSKQADSDEYSLFPLIYAVLFSFSTPE